MITKKTPINKVLEFGKECKQCGHCCSYGSGYVIKSDIKRIAKYVKMSEKKFIEKCLEPITKFNTTLHKVKTIKNGRPYGVCIFLDGKNNCTIHDVKPLHCRIGNCSTHGEELSVWFSLNYFVNPTDPESIRQWALYLVSEGKNIPGGRLRELVADEETLKKILNYEVLK